METLVIKGKSYKILVDSKIENVKNFLSADLEQLEDKKLVEYNSRSTFKVKFVGVFTTPNYDYISLPKKFTVTEDNVELIKKVLNKYKKIKIDGKILITNYSFIPKTGEYIESDIFYFNKLKEYFLDYITYEFIYPEGKITKHSVQPAEGTIDVPKTELNTIRYGHGLTYKIKDTKKEGWNLGDIYYSTIIKLSNSYGSDKDKLEIRNMKKYLDQEGFVIKEDTRILKEDISEDGILNDIKKCEVDIIHNIIKNTLIQYYTSMKIDKKHTIFAFFTKEFEYVWQYFSQVALCNSEKFKNKMNFFPTTILKDEEWIEKKSIPDIFSSYKGRKFLGDSKYYSNLDNDFNKEMYTYNQAQENVYHMVVFAPDQSTKYHDIRQSPLQEEELIVIQLSLEEVIKDIMNDTKICIEKVQDIISKATQRKF